MPTNNSPSAGPSKRPEHEDIQEHEASVEDLSDGYAELSGEEAEGLNRVDDEPSESGEEEEASEESDGSVPVDVKGKGVAVEEIPSWSTLPDAPRSSASKSFWTDLDLSIIVAIVSPIGNWLTGGDHIKNLLLIILLIFYLHQLIEGKLIPETLPT